MVHQIGKVTSGHLFIMQNVDVFDVKFLLRSNVVFFWVMHPVFHWRERDVDSLMYNVLKVCFPLNYYASNWRLRVREVFWQSARDLAEWNTFNVSNLIIKTYNRFCESHSYSPWCLRHRASQFMPGQLHIKLKSLWTSGCFSDCKKQKRKVVLKATDIRL